MWRTDSGIWRCSKAEVVAIWSWKTRRCSRHLLCKVRDGIVFMLTIYAKNEDESIPTHVLRKIKEEVDG